MTTVTVSATQARALPGCFTREINAGEAMNVGDVVQIVADGDVEMANATTAAGASGVLGWVAAGEGHAASGAIAANERITIVLTGSVYLGEDAALDETKNYYVGSVDGDIVDVAPTYFRVIGAPISSVILFFNPVMTEPGS